MDGLPKDAINYPHLEKPKIIISQKSWNRLTLAQQEQLVLHEMLPIAGFSDSDYMLSSDLMKKTTNGIKASRDIAKAITNCDISALRTISRTDLMKTSFYNMPLATLNLLCLPALEMLVQNSWDLNRCNSNGETLLTAAINHKACWFDSPSWGPSSQKRRIEYETFIKKIIEFGGTQTCSGVYEVPSFRSCNSKKAAW